MKFLPFFFFVNFKFIHFLLVHLQHKYLTSDQGIDWQFCIFPDGGLRCRVLAAFDINPVTNTIYQANFPDTKVYQKNIQVLILAIMYF